MNTELLDGLVVILGCIAFNGAIICAVLLARRHKRQTLLAAGAAGGFVLAGSIFIGLLFWSTTYPYDLLWPAGYFDLVWLSVVFVMRIRRWCARRKTDHPLKKRWLVLDCVGLTFCLLSIALFLVVFLMEFFSLKTLALWAAAGIVMGLFIIMTLRWKPRRKRGEAIKKVWKIAVCTILVPCMVVALLAFPFYMIFDWFVRSGSENLWYRIESDTIAVAYANNSTHFYWLEEDDFHSNLFRVPLQDFEGASEEIPLPTHHSGHKLRSWQITGSTENELFTSAVYAPEDESLAGAVDESGEVVYRISLDTFMGSPVEAEQQNDPKWRRKSENSEEPLSDPQEEQDLAPEYRTELQLRNKNGVRTSAVCYGYIFFVQDHDFYRMSADGKYTRLLESNVSITMLKNVNGKLYSREEETMPIIERREHEYSFHFSNKSSWLHLDKDGGIRGVLATTDGVLAPIGKKILVQHMLYYGENGNNPLYSIYDPADNSLLQLGAAGVKDEPPVPATPDGDTGDTEYSFAQDYAKTPEYFYHLSREYHRYDEYTTTLRRVPLQNLSKVKTLALPDWPGDNWHGGQSICGVTEDALLVYGSYSADDEREVVAVYQIPHKTGKAELLLETDRADFGTPPYYNAASGSLLFTNKIDGHIEIEAFNLGTGESKTIFDGTDYPVNADQWRTLPDGRAALQIRNEYLSITYSGRAYICTAYVLADRDNKISLASGDSVSFPAYRSALNEDDCDTFAAAYSAPIFCQLEVEGRTYCLAYVLDGSISKSNIREAGFYELDEYGHAEKPIWRTEESANYGRHSLVPLGKTVMIIDEGGFFAALYNPAAGTIFAGK